MLNISDNKVIIEESDYEAFEVVTNPYKIRAFAMWLLALIGILILVLFLPWTQNIQIEGKVTSLRPQERPQTIHAIIPGSIQEWYVEEGDTVKQGDTLVRLAEVKGPYFDDNYQARLNEQLYNKKEAALAYREKIRALLAQKQALERGRELKLSQAQNKIRQKGFKVVSDSGKLVAAEKNLEIAQNLYDNTKTLYDQQLKSLAQLQEKQQKLQEKEAKLIALENQYEITQNELVNARIKLSSIKVEYIDKISKVQTYIFSSKSDLNKIEAEVSKLSSKLNATKIRQGYLYVTASQDGYITKALKMGIGETVKSGTPIVSIMPQNHQLAAELYVDPVDLPLISKDHQVRLIFDGWPTFVLSGWPDVSYGTFAGEIVAVDNMISSNGKYRILVSPLIDVNEKNLRGLVKTEKSENNKDDKAWPIQLRIGSGCKGMALLNDVPVWQEIWRQLNGFPQDFYDRYKPHPYEHHKRQKQKKKAK
ncbi:MAG: HlyD family efflux transporter periplasmic adaptor subunit [Cytophagales bacterium]|nr:HlyD family efflux transporter periplasmic adaptor subunit [Cytophagales bacterium]